MISLEIPLINDVIRFLVQTSVDPVLYTVVLFIFAILDASILPLPAETGLLISLGSPPSATVRALVFGAGTAVGSSLVFLLGRGAESWLDRLGARWEWFGKLLKVLREFVAKTRYLGIFLFLSIPGMPDALPSYFFSFFNRRGVMELRLYLPTVFLGGVTRAAIIYALLALFGIRVT